MSTKTYDDALDFLPQGKTGNGGKFLSTLKLIAQALREGRNAEANYKREIARGTEPSKAAAKAFTF